MALQSPGFEPEEKIANIVHQLLKERAVDKPFNFNENLLSVGLTSLEMTNLVLSIEEEFSIRIPDRAITPANFMTVATIGGLIRDLMTPSVDGACRGSEPAESGSNALN
jgi:acyl carrier protein